MRLLSILMMIHFTLPAAMAETWLDVDSRVSTGKIILDGREVGTDPDRFLKGSGREKTVNRNLSDYHRLYIGSGGFDVIYTAGNVYSLNILGDDNLVAWLQTEVKDGELRLAMTRSYSTKRPLTVTITSPRLEAVTLEGSSTVTLNAIRAANFWIHSIGAGEIAASGEVAFLRMDILGSGDVNARKLKANRVEVEVRGAGDVMLTARESLNAAVSGAGDILYFGRPEEIHTEISGVGDLEPGE